MIVHRATRTTLALATTLVLVACAPYNPTQNQIDRNYPDSVQADQASASPSYYRGTENGVSAVNGDAAINANVITTLSRLPKQEGTNIQVSTYNGVVTLRGVANTSQVAQSNVQAARQVPGVQRVDYDIQVLRH